LFRSTGNTAGASFSSVSRGTVLDRSVSARKDTGVLNGDGMEGEGATPTPDTPGDAGEGRRWWWRSPTASEDTPEHGDEPAAASGGGMPQVDSYEEPGLETEAVPEAVLEPPPAPPPDAQPEPEPEEERVVRPLPR